MTDTMDFTQERLREIWLNASPKERRELLEHWRKNAHRLTWQERRFIRKFLLDGEPITPELGTASNARSLERDREVRAERLRLIKTYGVEGRQAIETLADRLLARRPAVPEARAMAWAEKVYRDRIL